MSEIKIDFTYWENIFCHHIYNKYLITVIYIAFTKLSTNQKQLRHKLGRRNGKTSSKKTHRLLCAKNSSSLLIFREVQIIMTMQFINTPVRLPSIKKKENYWRKWNHHPLLVQISSGVSNKNNMKLLKILRFKRPRNSIKLA